MVLHESGDFAVVRTNQQLHPEEMQGIAARYAEVNTPTIPLDRELQFEMTLRDVLFEWYMFSQRYPEKTPHSRLNSLLTLFPTPKIFDYILYSSDTLAKHFRMRLLEPPHGMLPVIEEHRDIFKKYIEHRFDCLDDVSQDAQLARALGVNNSRQAILHTLLINNMISDTFADLNEYLMLVELESVRKEIRALSKPSTEKKENPFSGFGKCFENCAAILLSLQCPGIVEHQVKLPSYTGADFRVADFALLTQDNPIIFEVKSGQKLSKRDEEQLQDFLETGYTVTYVVYDDQNNLSHSLREKYPQVVILPIQELAEITGFSPDSPLAQIFSDKDHFHALKESGISAYQLERDLFSIYYHLIDNPEHRKYVHEMIDTVMLQIPECKAELTEQYNIHWMTQRVYTSIQASYFEMTDHSGKRTSAVYEKLRRAQKKLLKLQTE